MQRNILFFPNEIMIKILYHCDPETVENARRIDMFWCSLVDSMINTTQYWKETCERMIGAYDLYELKKVFIDDRKNDLYWYLIYLQWTSWNRLENLQIIVKQFYVPHICGEIYCTKILENIILIGTNLGYIYQYDFLTGFFITKVEHCHVPIMDIDSMDVTTSEKLGFDSPYVFLKLETSTVLAYKFDDDRFGGTFFPSIKLNGIVCFRQQFDHFAYVDTNNELRVGVFKNKDTRLSLETLCSTSLNDEGLLGLSLWDSYVTTLYKKEMEVFKFRNFNQVHSEDNLLQSSKMLLSINKWQFKHPINAAINYCFYNGISFSLAYGYICVRSIHDDFQKKFQYDFDYGVPSAVLLYGRILVIGCERGQVI